MSQTDIMYIKQSNDLSSARYSWTLVQKKLLYIIFQMIQSSGDIEKGNNLKMTFSDKYLIDIDGNITRIYTELANMRKKDIQINTNKRWLTIGIINYVEHRKGEHNIEIEISHKILPHLLELSSQFTNVNLRIAMRFKSVYSQRFYELCCQYNKLSGFSFFIDDLKKMFGVENQYRQYGEFVKNIIDVAHKELKTQYAANECDVYFEWSVDEATKIGKKITRLNFCVISKNIKENKDITFADYVHKICDDWGIRYLGRTLNEQLRRHLFLFQEQAPEIHSKFKRIIMTYKYHQDISKVLQKMLKEDYLNNKNKNDKQLTLF